MAINDNAMTVFSGEVFPHGFRAKLTQDEFRSRLFRSTSLS